MLIKLKQLKSVR